MTTYAYARVSTDAQDLTAQLAQLRAAGAERVFKEKVSGRLAGRKELARMLAKIEPGDVVMVTKIDRLSRSLMELFSIVKQIDDKGGRFRSLDPSQAMADTGNTNGRLMLALMGWMADVERDLIVSRTSEGLRRARERGVRTGPKPKLNLVQKREALKRRDEGDETLRDIAATFGVSPATIHRLRA